MGRRKGASPMVDRTGNKRRQRGLFSELGRIRMREVGNSLRVKCRRERRRRGRGEEEGEGEKGVREMKK